MRSFWQFLYSIIVIPALWTSLHLLGLFKEKVRKGIAGRKGLFEDIERQVGKLQGGKRVWFHSASMGEFEQAKPIIAALKERRPDVRIIVTFFSPSGFEHSRDYEHASVLCYLPFDTRRNAQRFLQLVKPDAAVMIRYDVWPNHIWEAQRRGVSLIIANATMHRQTMRRLPFIRAFHRYVYNAFNAILAVSANDVQGFEAFRVTMPRIVASGDTRHDQVRARSIKARENRLIPDSILHNRKVLVVGSSWPEDEDVILPAALKLKNEIRNLLIILVPHEPSEEHLLVLESRLNGDSLRYSDIGTYADQHIIVVDRVGILLPLYAHAHVAFIGGSFKKGIHNVLEAAVFGIPVLFGPRHRNSQEPLQLLDAGGGFVVGDTDEAYRALENLLSDEIARTSSGRNAAVFVEKHLGATERFVSTLEQYLTKP